MILTRNKIKNKNNVTVSLTNENFAWKMVNVVCRNKMSFKYKRPVKRTMGIDKGLAHDVVIMKLRVRSKSCISLDTDFPSYLEGINR